MTKEILTNEQIKALEIKKEKINKEMNNYSSCLNDLKNEGKGLEEEVVRLKEEVENQKELIEQRKNEVDNVEKIIGEKKDSIIKIEKDKDIVKKEIKKEEEVLGDVKKKKKLEEKEIGKLLVNKASLIAREDYVNNQELYIKDLFERLGQEYQDYA